MKRVTIVNLAGRAVHIEDDGVAAIDAWLAEASARLATDPDRDELLADFERAIADRCAQHAPSASDVVTSEQVTGLLAALGTVEPAPTDDAAGGDAADATTQLPSASAATAAEFPAGSTGWRERKLYRLEGDDAMLAGVCAGIAAYLRMDVTVVRVLFVLLVFLTSGFALLAYVIMWLLVPAANSPAEHAAAHGHGETAQEMLARTREGAAPALASFGRFLNQAGSMFVLALRWLLLSCVWIILIAWGIAATWILLDGGGLLSAFDAGTSTWLVALWVTCAAWVAISLLLWLAGPLRSRSTQERARGTGPRRTAINAVWIVSVVAAASAFVMIPLSSSQDLRGLEDGQGRIEIGDETLCLESDNDSPSVGERCRPGDEVIQTD